LGLSLQPLWAQSQTPSPSQATQQHSDTAEPEQRGTEESPVFVKVVPADPGAEESQQQRGTEESPVFVKVVPADPGAEESQQHQLDRQLVDYTRDLAIATDDLAKYTGWLFGATVATAFATLLLFGIAAYQGRHTKAALAYSAATAKAAVDSVNEFREKERARVVVINPNWQFSPNEDPGSAPKTYTIRVTHQFLNYGATPAVLGDYKGKIFFATSLPENPASDGGTIRIGPFQTPLLTNQLGDAQEINDEVTLDQDEWDQVRADTPGGFKMFVIISVVFKDTFGTIRTAFFALKFKGSYFVPSGDEAYNYERVGEIEW
jgi:hypothetical protein